jgi:RNA polymerase sigma-70 factor (ECF subfamily)
MATDALERRLVEQVAERRNESAFRELYRRHSPALYGLLLRLLGGREAEAQDLLQETWIRAVGRLSTFPWESALRTWLCGIAVHCGREWQRRERSAALEPLEKPEQLPARHPSSHPDGRMDWERAIRGLPDGYRQVLVLCDIEGYTHREVAGLLGISAGTSKSQLARARRALRAWTGTDGGTP